jgi:hypothetical protein
LDDVYGNYIVYVDESGDHSLTSIDSEYPLFVLTLTIFDKEQYSYQAVPLFKKLKFAYFGHDIVVLHENEIRRRKNEFKILYNKERHNAFIQDLSTAIAECDFDVIAVLIDKKKLTQKYAKPYNPYHIALKYSLERLYDYLDQKNDVIKTTHVIVEKRGQREDDELELEFRRICDGHNRLNKKLPFDIIMADKKTNSTGLQLSDMIARPIGIHYLDPIKENRAYKIIEEKFYRDDEGNFEEVGLKCFP